MTDEGLYGIVRVHVYSQRFSIRVIFATLCTLVWLK